MQIKNTSAEARTLSHEGVDHPLFPGAAVELPLLKDEAEALRGIGFDVTGDPVKPEKKEKAA